MSNSVLKSKKALTEVNLLFPHQSIISGIYWSRNNLILCSHCCMIFLTYVISGVLKFECGLNFHKPNYIFLYLIFN